MVDLLGAFCMLLLCSDRGGNRAVQSPLCRFCSFRQSLRHRSGVVFAYRMRVRLSRTPKTRRRMGRGGDGLALSGVTAVGISVGDRHDEGLDRALSGRRAVGVGGASAHRCSIEQPLVSGGGPVWVTGGDGHMPDLAEPSG